MILAGAAPGAIAAEPAPVLITVDQAMVLRLPSDARAIVVGNPAIADATIMDPQTLVITGRSFGTTNLIVLDVNGVIIVQEMLTVQSSLAQVTVYRRSIRETYSCTPVCQPTVNVGDGGIFDATTAQVQARTALATGN
jgi:hypothetical protein